MGPKDTLSLGEGVGLPLMVTGTFQDSSMRVVDPAQLSWSFSPQDLGSLEPGGVLRANHPGSGTITVSSGSITAYVSLTVVNSTAAAWGQTNLRVVDPDNRRAAAWGQTNLRVVDPDNRRASTWGQTDLRVTAP